MKKTAIVLIALLMCIAMSSLAVGQVKTAAPAPSASNVDTVVSATPNYYRNFSESYLKALPVAGGYYTCLKNKPPYGYFWQEWYGVGMANLLNEEVGLMPGSTGVRLYAADGWTVDYTMDMVMNLNSQGLPFILAWQKGPSYDDGTQPPPVGPPLPEITDPTEGPFRSAYGQQPNVGPYNVDDPAAGGTPNYQNFLKTVRAVEVQPLPSGTTPVDATTIPADKVVVYGNIEPYRITDISPTSGPVGTEVTVNGFGFGSIQGTSTVSFAGVPATVVSWDCKQIVCQVPSGLPLGAADVTVTTDNDGLSNAVPFEVTEAAAPTVTSVSPTQSINLNTFNMNIVGTGFQAGATVRMVKDAVTLTPTKVTVVSDTQITCTFKLNYASLGKYDVIVQNPDMQEGKWAKQFVVTNLCGASAAVSVAGLGLVMGLLSIAGLGGSVLRRRRKK
jgi:IPT/TIG domain